MAEYIEREALRDALYDADAITMNGVKILNQFPSADVAPVQHGRWVEAKEPLGWNDVTVASCSVCGDSWVLDEFTIDEYAKFHPYCSSCGAKMDEDDIHE